MSYAATAQDETEDRYYTQVEAGDVRLFTLDQLDAAYNAGLIHENTYVCLEGESTWSTLADVAGLGEEEPVSAPIPVAAPVSQQQHYAAYAPPARAPAQAASILPSSVPYSVAPTVIVAPSIAPVVNDLGFDDDDMMAMRPKRRAGKVLAGLAVVALAGLGFAVVQSGGIQMPKLAPGADKAAAASLALSPASEIKPTTPKVETPAPVAEAPKPEAPKAETEKSDAAEGSSATKKSDDRFSEEMKEALLNKDKKQAATQKTKKAARTVASKSRPAAKGSGGGFKAGGSAYDPLNGKL